MKNIKKIIAVLLCMSIALLCGCTTEKKPEQPVEEKTKTAYGYKFPAAICEGVSVEDFYLYSGEYIEDASFENCEKIVALKVKNTSETDIQLVRIKVKTDAKEMLFEITTLKAGATVIVLEKSKQTMGKNEKIIGFDYENRVDFKEKITLKDDFFLVKTNLKTINIKNISDNEIESDIYVYYKKKDADGNYFGGITFRTKADGLKIEEIKQLPASNFDPDNSEVLFVDYAN